jgi:hypothetical protein
MYKNFAIPGRQNSAIKGTPLPRTAGLGDSPWYVPGMRRRRARQGVNQITELTLTYGNEEITYNELKFTYTRTL